MVSSRDARRQPLQPPSPPSLFFRRTSEYFKSGGKTISSWHIINYTCRSFPLGRSSDTLENKSPDAVLNQRDTACEAGVSADTFKKVGEWIFFFSFPESGASGVRHRCVRSQEHH